MGGAFEVDRVLQQTSGAVDELAFQAEQKIKAVSNYFHYLAINGTSASSGGDDVKNTFDGLKKTLEGSIANDFTTTVDLSTSEKLDSNYGAFLDELDAAAHAVDGGASMIMTNSKMLINFARTRAVQAITNAAPMVLDVR